MSESDSEPKITLQYTMTEQVAPTDKIDTFKTYEDQCSDSDEENQDLVFQDMQLFLHAIGEPQLVDKFLANKVTLGQLLEFDEQDLINCGVDLVGDRKKILTNTGQMHSEKWMPSSLEDLTAKSLLSSPGIYITLNDINKHIEYIGFTIKYLKKKIEANPEILELGKDYVGIAKIDSEIVDLNKTSKQTYHQLKLIQKVIRKHLDDPAKKPANHIDANFIKRAKIRLIAVPTFLVSMGLLGMGLCITLKFSKLLSSYLH